MFNRRLTAARALAAPALALLVSALSACGNPASPVVAFGDSVTFGYGGQLGGWVSILSEKQVSIPELGTVRAEQIPLVFLTSNNTRELSEALKRRCLYLWLDYPALEHELEIVRLHAPELSETVARKLVEVIGMVRTLDLKKPPSIAESIDWARALLLLGVEDIDEETFTETMSVIVKHRTDMDVVAERVGLKLQSPADVA